MLEIGCGTGLILEALAKRRPDLAITGIDLTQAMINIAQQRLKGFSNISLACANVTDMQLSHPYEVAFSYGGVWYFVIDGDKAPFMVSHISPRVSTACTPNEWVWVSNTVLGAHSRSITSSKPAARACC